MITQSSDSVLGMNNAQVKLGKTAHSVANSKSSAVINTVDTINAKNQFKANSELIPTANQMLGTLLDLKA